MKKFYLLALFIFILFELVQAQIWTKKADLPDTTRLAVTSFSLQNEGYICCGKQSIYSTATYFKDFWRYQPDSNTWIQLTDFPGTARSGAISFVFDTVVFIGLGWEGANDLKDIFKYNINTGIWDTVSSYPGNGGRIGLGTSINGKGYYGGGTNGTNRQEDFWEYNPIMDTWTQKGKLPFGKRSNGIAIAYDSLIYMGLGFNDALTMHKDFWSYNPNTNIWTRLADIPGDARVGAVAMIFNGSLIVGGGQKVGGIEIGDYYSYNKAKNKWQKIKGPIEGFRSFSSSFSIHETAYLFAGNDPNNKSLNDLHAYEIDTTVSICDSLVWVKRKSFPDSNRAVTTSYALNGKGYICCGKDAFTGSNINFFKDNWEFDPRRNSWKRLNDFPGKARSGAKTFVFDTIAYVGLGWDGSNDLKDLFKYSVNSDTWDTVSSYPGNGGRIGFGTALNNKGYYGGGTDGTNRQNDFWEYNPSTDVWTQKGNLPFGRRSNGIAIGLDSLIYMGLGYNNSLTMQKDFWAYNPSIDKWTQLTDLPGPPRIGAIAILHNKKIIVGGGHKSGGIELGDYYEFNPISKNWRRVDPMLDSIRTFASSFSLDGSGYVFGGRDQNDDVLVDLWELSDFGFDTTLSFNACDSFTFAPNKTYYTSGVFYADTFRAIGCDTVVRLEITISKSSNYSFSTRACNSYTWAQNGQQYDVSGTFYDTIVNAVGCDSIVGLSLTIDKPVQLINNVNSCKDYFWATTNQIYTQSGTYTDTIFNGVSCDTLHKLNLSITKIDTTISISNDTLIANQLNASYQWLDCDNGNLPIPGSISNSFTPQSSGNYACQITINGCIDTTACYNKIVTSVEELTELSGIQVSPNPFKDQIYITLNEVEVFNLVLVDILGSEIYSFQISGNEVIDLFEYPCGIYFMLFKDVNNHLLFTKKLIKQ